MHRRKFIYILLISAIGFFSIDLFLESKKRNFELSISKEQKKIIKNYNKKRIQELKDNFKGEIINDFKNNKTIWLGRRIYTFSELYYLKAY